MQPYREPSLSVYSLNASNRPFFHSFRLVAFQYTDGKVKQCMVKTSRFHGNHCFIYPIL